MRKRVLQTVLISGLIAAQVVLQFPTVVYAESGEEVQTEVASTSGATEGTSGSDEGTSGASEGTSGSDEGTSVSGEGTSGADEGMSGSTSTGAEGSESNEAAGGTTTEGSESESSDSNEANTGESSESSEGTSSSVGGNSEDTSDTSETGSTESAELTYKVTFKDSLDETFEVVVEVEENASAEAPEAPEHEGYVFVEWDADFSSVTEDMTVTAQYEEVVATPVLRSPLRSPAGGTSPAFSKDYGDGTGNFDNGTINIKIEAAEGVIPDGAHFIVSTTPKYVDVATNVVDKYRTSNVEISTHVIRNISLFDNSNNPIQPNGSVTITISNRSMNSSSGYIIYTKAFAFYADAGGNLVELNCTDDGRGTVSFETDYFNEGGLVYDTNTGVYNFDHAKIRDFGVVYVKESCTVTYESNGGLPVNDVSVTLGDVIRPWKTTTKADFVFDGWYRDAGLTQPFTSTDVVTSNMTLYAKWKENTCTVTFDSKGGSPVSSLSVQKGATYITMPTSPTKADATFVWWYKDEDCTIPFDQSEAINSDMTLYAKWFQHNYLVTYAIPDSYRGYFRFERQLESSTGYPVVKTRNGAEAYKPDESNILNNSDAIIDRASYLTYDSASRSWTVKEIPQVGYTDPHPAYNMKFYGWYKDPTYTIPYDFTEPVTEDITLYPKLDKIPLAFGTVIDFYFDYGYNETRNKVIASRGRWNPDISFTSSHLTKKKVYYSKFVEDSDPTQMAYVQSPFSSRAVQETEGMDSGYKIYMCNKHAEALAPEGFMIPSQMYPGSVAVFFRYFFKDDSSPVPPTTPVQPSNPTPTPSDDPTPNPSEDPTPSVNPTPSVEPTETPSPTVSPSVSPAPSATPSPTVKPSAKPTQKPDSEDDEEDESGVLSSTHEVMDLVAEEVKEGSLTYVESNQFGFSRAYTLRYLNLDGKVK